MARCAVGFVQALAARQHILRGQRTSELGEAAAPSSATSSASASATSAATACDCLGAATRTGFRGGRGRRRRTGSGLEILRQVFEDRRELLRSPLSPGGDHLLNGRFPVVAALPMLLNHFGHVALAAKL